MVQIVDGSIPQIVMTSGALARVIEHVSPIALDFVRRFDDTDHPRSLGQLVNTIHPEPEIHEHL